jgi:hypothetical protein
MPEIADGPNDGGTDIRVYSLPPNPVRIGVQVSVEKDWKEKIEANAAKVNKKLGLECLRFISSRRIPEALFLPVQLPTGGVRGPCPRQNPVSYQ